MRTVPILPIWFGTELERAFSAVFSTLRLRWTRDNLVAFFRSFFFLQGRIVITVPTRLPWGGYSMIQSVQRSIVSDLHYRK